MPHEIRGVDAEKYALLCQQTSPKRWFGNVEMTSNCDVTSSANQIQMTTISSLPKPPHENFLRTPLVEQCCQIVKYNAISHKIGEILHTCVHGRRKEFFQGSH